MCIPDGDGVYVNPSLKLALTVKCIDYCVEPHSYRWITLDKNDVVIPPSGDEIVGMLKKNM